MMGKRVWDTERTIYHGPIARRQALPAGWMPATPAGELSGLAYGRRETPMARADTLEAGVWVPMLQAVFVGLAWGAVVGIGGGVVTVWQGWPWWLVALAVGATWAGVTAWHMTAGMRLRQELLWKREVIRMRDLDGDGVVGRPPALEPVTVRLEVVSDNGKHRRTQFLDVGVEPERVALFARSVLGGRGMAVNEWTGKGGLFSRSEFERLRGQLLAGGLVRWASGKDRRQGVELTRAGRAMFGKLADLSPTVDGSGVGAGGAAYTHIHTQAG